MLKVVRVWIKRNTAKMPSLQCKFLVNILLRQVHFIVNYSMLNRNSVLMQIAC